MNGIRGDELENRLAAPGRRSDGSPLPSRRRAIEGLLAHVLAGDPAPALLTGESGTGKTWVWNALARELPAGWQFLPVALSGALNADGLLELIADRLRDDRVDGTPGLAANRLAIARALRSEADDGRRWILVVEDAQNASREVWEELAALAQASDTGGEPAGFACMILVGPTSLARHLMERRRPRLAERLGLHIHLLPLDLDECRQLIDATESGPIRGLDGRALEELQRQTCGNPRRLLRELRSRAMSPGRGSRPVPGAPAPVPVAPPARPELLPRERPVAASNPPTPGRPAGGLTAALIPTRPPLRVEEGLIEVGWGGSLESDSDDDDGDDEASDRAESSPQGSPRPAAVPAPAPAAASAVATEEALTSAEEAEELPSEEMIEDHYAAIQAWSEWARNRGRAADPAVAAASDSSERRAGARPRSAPVTDEPELDVPDTDPLASNVRAEAEHEHAPYSQLFSRLRQARP
ncbi:ATP-binding protein [Aquisphaera insulae]|uniref:ATP-binding protein n=1 Tax=Aquisphaera insulae TaxID=2712864 RepID=UPI0013ED5AE0|nr:ATP-binding protein [Aquisphaera insulae]